MAIAARSAEPLHAAELVAGEGLPLDSKFALARSNAPFDPGRAAWLPKSTWAPS